MPKLLDLFCCEGGMGEGYRRAGFEVTGVDIVERRYRPGRFVQSDALEYFAEHWREYDAVHASPPCHDHSALSSVAGKDGSEWLLDATREAFAELPIPWVIENVANARMSDTLTLCGTQFGLRTDTEARGEVWLKRHRLFESNVHLVAPGPCHCSGRRIIGVYGHGDGGGRGWKGSFKDRQAVMGIDWMKRDELAQAIPPAYAEWIGSQLMAAVTDREDGSER